MADELAVSPLASSWSPVFPTSPGNRSLLLFVLRPSWSYRLNADFEDHAVHEYMALVAEHPEWENTPFESEFAVEIVVLWTKAAISRSVLTGSDLFVEAERIVHTMGNNPWVRNELIFHRYRRDNLPVHTRQKICIRETDGQ